MRFFRRELTSVPSIWLRPKVYVFGISFATAFAFASCALNAK
jgi:hypothetical protein